MIRAGRWDMESVERPCRATIRSWGPTGLLRQCSPLRDLQGQSEEPWRVGADREQKWGCGDRVEAGKKHVPRRGCRMTGAGVPSAAHVEECGGAWRGAAEMWGLLLGASPSLPRWGTGQERPGWL